MQSIQNELSKNNFSFIYLFFFLYFTSCFVASSAVVFFPGFVHLDLPLPSNRSARSFFISFNELCFFFFFFFPQTLKKKKKSCSGQTKKKKKKKKKEKKSEKKKKIIKITHKRTRIKIFEFFCETFDEKQKKWRKK